MIEVNNWPPRGLVSSTFLDNFSRNANHSGVCRHRLHYHRPCPNSAVTANGNRPKDFCPSTEEYPIFNCRVSLPSLGTRSSQRYSLIERDVVANFCGFSDHNSHAMIDKDSSTNTSPRMNLDPSKKPRDMADDTRQRRPPALPQPVRKPMTHHGMKPWVCKDNFPGRPCRRITFKNRSDVFSKFLPKHKCFHRDYNFFRSRVLLVIRVKIGDCPFLSFRSSRG